MIAVPGHGSPPGDLQKLQHNKNTITLLVGQVPSNFE